LREKGIFNPFCQNDKSRGPGRQTGCLGWLTSVRNGLSIEKTTPKKARARRVRRKGPKISDGQRVQGSGEILMHSGPKSTREWIGNEDFFLKGETIEKNVCRRFTGGIAPFHFSTGGGGGGIRGEGKRPEIQTVPHQRPEPRVFLNGEESAFYKTLSGGHRETRRGSGGAERRGGFLPNRVYKKARGRCRTWPRVERSVGSGRRGRGDALGEEEGAWGESRKRPKQLKSEMLKQRTRPPARDPPHSGA